ncbi:hypothetical protein [Parasitella parasitica]|uniref:Coatomer subunit alpha n=1 Tax=Parasitella parasitica TaxID=35722 RepID=A0A0B7NK35_9FUNG|nr:hypothetical protein [Parasitella parasitica]
MGNDLVKALSPIADSYRSRVVSDKLAEDGGLYELYKLPKSASNKTLEEPYVEANRGVGYNALFIARNRFAVFDRLHQQIEIRDLSNTITKSFKTPVIGVTDIFYAGTGSLLLTTATHVILFDIQQRRIFTEIMIANIKYVVWSNDYSMAALLSRHTITLVDKNLKQIGQIHETIRIKSGVWDESGVFLYCTLNHIKYTLPQGDHGIIRTLDQPLYMASVKDKSLLVLNREGKAVKLAIDPTEFKFKLALANRNYDQVLYIIRNSSLVGQAIIGYLQQKGYPEIALNFVRDDSTRFELALECGNLDVALNSAQKLDTKESWDKLGSEALRHGNFKMVELAYQRTKNYDRLSFLYLAAGNETNLRQMMKIAQMRGDPMSRLQNAMYLGDVSERIRLLQDVGQTQMAYLTAKSHGFHEKAQSILTMAGIAEQDIDMTRPAHGENSSKTNPLQSALPLQDHNWPLLTVSKNFFEGVFAANNNNQIKSVPAFHYDEGIDNIEDAGGDWGAEQDEDILGISLPKMSRDNTTTTADQLDEGEAGWDDDDDIHADIAAEISQVAARETAEFVAPAAGMDEAALWVQTSCLAADHISAGSFETAMQILNRQVGAVNFSPLKTHFLAVYQTSRILVPSNAANPSLPVYLRRNPDTATSKSSLPIVAYSLQHLATVQLQLAYRLFTNGKLPASATQFKTVLHSLLFTVVSEKADADEANQLVQICREYALGLAIEQQRRSVTANDPNDTKRALELAAYFTHCQLQTPHLQQALRQAAKQAFKLKNFNTASQFCTRLLELAPPKKIADEARQILDVCQKSPKDEIQLHYDQHNPFVVCGLSYEPIYKGSLKATCPFCQAAYKLEYKNKVCNVCHVSQIGSTGSGFRVMI